VSATGVPLTSVFYVRFNRPVKPSTVTSSNLVLSIGLNPVLRSVSVDPCIPQMVAITPLNPLTDATVYTLTIGAGLTDNNGVATAGESYTITTTTNADSTRPDFSGAITKLGSTKTSLDIQWPAAVDAPASAIQYEITVLSGSACFDPTATPIIEAGLSRNLTGLASDTAYDIQIRARDAAGNLSAASLSIIAKTLTSWSQDVYAEIITTNRCLNCHFVGGIAPFSMETQALAWQNLVDPMFNDVFCSGAPVPKRVVPSNSADSFLYRKISLDNPGCGVRMPFDGPPYLGTPQIQTIKDWIDEGALDN
jgi:hypothetical protein